MNKPILCLDFDGVIHSYTSGWKGADVIPDPPVPGALRWLWKATEWWDVQIYSSRSKEKRGREAMQAWMLDHARAEFGPDHPMSMLDGERDQGFQYPITFAADKPAAFLTIDDRAICFEGDWSELDAVALTQFKPWNKRMLMLSRGNCGDRCPVCLGDKTLAVIVYDRRGKFLRYGADVECEACDGRGYVMTAARAAQEAQHGQP